MHRIATCYSGSIEQPNTLSLLKSKLYISYAGSESISGRKDESYPNGEGPKYVIKF